MIGLLVGLSLAESEIEGVHNHGDEALAQMLQAHDLLGWSVEVDKSAAPVPDGTGGGEALAVAAASAPTAFKYSVEEFNLVLSEPKFSFYVLIAADFLCLLAFLAALIFFVRLSEREEQRKKQLQKAKVQKPSAERPLM